MTTLEKIMKKENISNYKINKLLGYNLGMAGYIKSQTSGRTTVSMVNLQKILNIISKISGKVYCIDDLKYDLERVRIR